MRGPWREGNTVNKWWICPSSDSDFDLSLALSPCSARRRSSIMGFRSLKSKSQILQASWFCGTLVALIPVFPNADVL